MPHRVYSTPNVAARLSQLARAKRFAIVTVLPSAGSAYMSTRHVKSPPPLFLFFLSSCPPFLLFDRAAAFSRPDRRIVVGRRAQMLSRLAASSAATTLWGASAFTAIEHDGRLDGSGRLHSCLLFICLECQRALFR